jgi:hypothetical protein
VLQVQQPRQLLRVLVLLLLQHQQAKHLLHLLRLLFQHQVLPHLHQAQMLLMYQLLDKQVLVLFVTWV